jgi:hypothetical protein
MFYEKITNSVIRKKKYIKYYVLCNGGGGGFGHEPPAERCVHATLARA